MEESLEDLRLKDPLSAVTRNERRLLLAVSAIGIVIVRAGFVPSRISALGIEFSQTDQRSLLLTLAAIVGYFLIAFLVYAVSDFLAWRVAFQMAAVDLASAEEGEAIRIDDADFIRIGVRPFSKRLIRMVRPASFIRGMFEFVLPILIGLFAIVLLVLGA